jgi:hypothetical protein
MGQEKNNGNKGQIVKPHDVVEINDTFTAEIAQDVQLLTTFF